MLDRLDKNALQKLDNFGDWAVVFSEKLPFYFKYTGNLVDQEYASSVFKLYNFEKKLSALKEEVMFILGLGSKEPSTEYKKEYMPLVEVYFEIEEKVRMSHEFLIRDIARNFCENKDKSEILQTIDKYFRSKDASKALKAAIKKSIEESYKIANELLIEPMQGSLADIA